MKFYKMKYLARILSVALIFSMLTSSVTPVYATDTVESLENELSGLDSELKKISSDIASTAKQIEEMTTRINELKEELAIAKGEEEAQYESMKTRIQYMYENGGNNILEILFSASSLADFLKKADYYATMNEYDRNALKKLAKTRENITAQEAQLEAEQASLIALQKDLNEKEAIIGSESSKLKKQLAAAREEAKKAEEALKQQVKPVVPTNPPTDSSGSDDFKPNLDYTTSASDIELFAALIECEAGSSNYEGMLAVASVVVNRMKDSRYPTTRRGVIMQSGQFPPAHNGLVDKKLARGVKASCLQVAQDALAGKNNVGGCLSFRSASSGHAGIIIGGNVFF